MDEAGIFAGWAAPTYRLAAAGEEGFRQLYEATSRPLWGYVHHASGRADVADDLLQETYCRFLARRAPAMDAAQVKSYLFRIATNLLHDRFRSPEAMAGPEASDRGVEQDQDAHLDVREAMRQLKPRERELLWLAYVEGMSHAEIAAATGLSTLSIRMLLFRARRKAGRILRPQETTS